MSLELENKLLLQLGERENKLDPSVRVVDLCAIVKAPYPKVNSILNNLEKQSVVTFPKRGRVQITSCLTAYDYVTSRR